MYRQRNSGIKATGYCYCIPHNSSYIAHRIKIWDGDSFPPTGIENGEVVEYDKINISPTIGREDGTFGFGFFEYDTDLSLFIENAEKEIHRVKNSTGLSFSKDTARADVIRYSALPWFAFSEMKHAGSIQTGDSIPKISTGKLIQEKKKLLLPISISVHHGLVDGRNVAEFIQNVKDGQNNTL